MNNFIESTLIASAPPEILAGLALFFLVAGLILWRLSMEDGKWLAYLEGFGRRVRAATWPARGRRRRLFIPGAARALARGHRYDSAV
jgi:hypothetical protein